MKRSGRSTSRATNGDGGTGNEPEPEEGPPKLRAGKLPQLDVGTFAAYQASNYPVARIWRPDGPERELWAMFHPGAAIPVGFQKPSSANTQVTVRYLWEEHQFGDGDPTNPETVQEFVDFTVNELNSVGVPNHPATESCLVVFLARRTEESVPGNGEGLFLGAVRPGRYEIRLGIPVGPVVAWVWHPNNDAPRETWALSSVVDSRFPKPSEQNPDVTLVFTYMGPSGTLQQFTDWIRDNYQDPTYTTVHHALDRDPRS